MRGIKEVRDEREMKEGIEKNKRNGRNEREMREMIEKNERNGRKERIEKDD